MAWATKAEVKYRLQTEIPTGVTTWDTQLDEAIDYAARIIRQMYYVEGISPPDVTGTPPGVIADACADISAAVWIEWNYESYGEALGKKGARLRKQGEAAVLGYLKGQGESVSWISINDVDSAV